MADLTALVPLLADIRPGAKVYVPGATGEPTLLRLALEADPGRAGNVHFTSCLVPGMNDFDYAALDPLSLHIAFKADDVAQERQRLLDAGARLAGDIVTTETGDVMTFVRDPWHVTVQLVKRIKPMI